MNDAAEGAGPAADTAARILQDLGAPAAVNAAAGGSWKAPLWQAVEDAGLTLAWVPAALGGAGAGIIDGFEILRVAGRFAVAVPLAETLLAGWLLAEAGLPAPKGPMSAVPARDGDRIVLSADGVLTGSARSVPFAGEAAHLVVLAARRDGCPAVALVETAALRITGGRTLAGDDAGDVSFDGVVPIALDDVPPGRDADALLVMGAAVRSMQMAGALQAVLDLSVRYADERVAFGRTIAKFQAVQHNLARLAGEAAAATAASGSAADAIARAERFDHGILLEAASAKIRTGQAAGEGAAIAHQVHGAIGFTREYVLHRFTRRLWTWRDDFGNESQWAVRLGNIVAAQGADGLWPMLSER